MIGKGRAALLCAAMVLAAGSQTAQADEGGVSFWLPGQYGSFAAVPLEPGWSLGTIYYHTSIGAGGSKELEIGGNITGDISADANFMVLAPNYAFDTPVLGGQLALSLTAIVGSNDVTGRVSLTGPGGSTISAKKNDSIFDVGDLYPAAVIRWNDGTSNFMTYLTGDIPVGAYQTGRLANIGIGHAAIDGGVGYTYLDPAKGHEFSIVTGLTYNFENSHTDYQNGIDFHLDWAASQFVSETTHVGLVGYAYQQLSGDSGGKLGDFKSRVFAIGPEVGHFFPLGGHKAYVNLKGYYEFGAENRPSGWNAWAILSVPLGG